MQENKEFKILSKIKSLISYCNTYVLNTIPKTEITIRINFEQNIYKLLEEVYKADLNRGNIRCKSIRDMQLCCRMIDYYLGLLYEKKIITKARFITIVGILNEISKMSQGWLMYEERSKTISQSI